MLSGCNWMDGEPVSVTPHRVHSQTGSDIKLSATNEKELEAALADLIATGKEKGVIFVGGYDQNEVTQGMERAVEYTLSMTPLGAYAVEAMDWDLGNSGGKPAIALEITYRRSLTGLRSIRRLSDMDAAAGAIEKALSDHAASLVLEVAVYEEVDISQWVEDYAQQNPQYVMEIPEVTVGVYPESGKTRIVELKFTFQNSRDNLRHARSGKVIASHVQRVIRGTRNQLDILSVSIGYACQRDIVFLQVAVEAVHRGHYIVRGVVIP
jgi:hypothetical protein